MNTLTKVMLLVVVGLGAGIGSFLSSAPAAAVEDPPAAKAGKADGTIGCADARSVMQAYLYRDSTLEAMAAALDADEDRWQKANEAFLKVQRDAFAAGDEGPSDDQWKAVEDARRALMEVHESITEAFDKVLGERARAAQGDVAAAIERVAQARGCTAVHQRSAFWGRTLPDDEFTDTFEESALLWADGLVDLNDDLLKDLGLPRDALEPSSTLAARVEALFARFQRMTTLQPPELPGDEAAPEDPGT